MLMLMQKLKLPLKPTVDTTVAVDTVVVDTADTVEREQPFLKPKPNPKLKLPLLPILMPKLKLKLIMDMEDTVDTEDMADMVDIVVDTARDLLNLTLSLKLKPTMVDTMVDTVDTVVDMADMVDMVDTEVMVMVVDTTDKCHLSSQIFM